VEAQSSRRRLEDHATVGSGEIFELMLLARQEPGKFFIFTPQNPQDAASSTFDAPDERAQFDAPQDFVVTISYSYGRQKLKFNATIRKTVEGGLVFETPAGGGGGF